MKRMNKTKTILVLAMAAVILLASVGTTLAFLTTKTEPITNTFQPTSVTCEVEDNMEDNVKSNIIVKNTGTADAYIRVTIVANWVKDDNIVAPWMGTYPDAANGWQERGEYYYYPLPVAPDTSTPALFDASIEAGNSPVTGAHLEMTVIAQAIQATSAAAYDAWQVTYNVVG